MENLKTKKCVRCKKEDEQLDVFGNCILCSSGLYNTTRQNKQCPMRGYMCQCSAKEECFHTNI